MAVLGRLLISSAERIDLPDLLSMDSYSAGDWKFFLKGLVGDDKPYILKGFDIIDPQNAIGTQGCSIRVADSVVFYPGSNSGSFFHGLQEGHAQAAPLVPELRKNATNFIYATFSTFNTSVDTRAFWDPDKDGGAGGEFTQDVNTESVLKVDINVSTGSFPANTIPIAKVVVGAVTITSITDCRDLLFRLGTGGISPDPFGSYSFRSLPSAGYQRSEPSITMSAGGDNPFQGGDKNIYSLKEWMDLVMTKFKELSGTTYWYEDLSTYNIVTGFVDALSTTFKSKGKWQHSSATPGLVTWTEDITIKITQDPRDVIVRAGNKTLANEQVAYLALQRKQLFNSSDNAVSWTNGQPYINTVGGAVGYFANLAKGDWVKKVNDANHLFLRVEEFYDSVSLGGSTTTAANARSVRLSGNYQGTTVQEKGRFDKGVYLASDVVVSDRNQSALSTAGGNFHWMVVRSDVIENIATIDSFALGGAISQPDGKTAKVTSTSHGLSDGDYVTITAPAAQAGTYKIEVEDADTFYIQTTSMVTGSLTAFYGLLTTAARTNGYGLQLESANHGFESGDTVQIAGTTNYNGAKVVNKRSATQIQFGFGSNQAVESTGTATLARVNVRAEEGLLKIVQGGEADIGGGALANVKSFIGMQSDAETYPSYIVPTSYNTLDGMANYNGSVTDSLTARTSKLTAMMSDKAQDKTVKYLPSGSLTNINNTTNGAAQEITFDAAGSTLTLLLPGSDGSATVALPNTAPGISLLVNQVAYVEVDRNNATTPSIQVANTSELSIDENIFVIAARLSDTNVYVWEGSIITSGAIPVPGYLPAVVRQNQTIKLVEGGTWAWDALTSTLSWSSNAYMQIPGLANSVNQINTGSVVLSSGQVAYVDINRSGPGGSLVVNAATNSSLALTTDRFVIARRVTAGVLVGNNSFLLKDGEQLELDGALAEINRNLGQLKLTKHATVANKAKISGADITQLSGDLLSQEMATLLMDFDGAVINFSTGVINKADDVTSLGIAFTPFSIPVGQYFWYGVGLLPNTTTADNRINAQVQVTPALSANAVQANAPYPNIIGTKKLGAVQVFNNAGSIEVVSVHRLGTGSGSGGGTGTIKAELYDPVSTSLPTGASPTIDGTTLLENDLVFFTNLSVNNNRIYKATNVAVSVVWQVQRPFDNSAETPSSGDAVRIKKGSLFAGQTVYLDDAGNFTVNDAVRFFDGNKGTNYWELGSIKTATLNDNTTNGTIFTVTAAGSENWIVNYSVVRGSTNKETGQIYITSNGTTCKATTANSFFGDPGVTFDVQISGPNLELLYTTTSTGASATMKFYVSRWADASGGPSGVPSYPVSGSGTPAAGSTGDIQFKGGSGNLSADSRFNIDTASGNFNLNGLLLSVLQGPVVLADNTVGGTAFSFPKVYKWMIVEYSLERNGEDQVGRLMIVNNGTTVSITNDNTSTAALGVTFAAAVNVSNIDVQYTSTNTGFTSSMKYTMRRWQ